MNDEHVKKQIIEGVSVSRLNVSIAKAFILTKFDPDAAQLIESFLRSVDAKVPEKIVIHPTVDSTSSIRVAIEALSWRLAACEAIWGLISSGLVFPASPDLCGEIRSIEWTTVVAGSGSSGGLSLNELSILVPRKLAISRSAKSALIQPLSDHDIYLKELNLPGLSSEIESALREAVQCFRNDLYLACLAMLGRASEAAWIELGLALCNATSSSSLANIDKLRDQLQDPFIGIGKKIKIVSDMYSNQSDFPDLAKSSGVRVQDLKNCVVWADCVRESRNSIHYGAEPPMSNSHEKVAALLIGGVPHIRLLTVLTAAARQRAEKNS